jgi:tetratricopeptide (TPR) repeat protein
VRKGILAFLLSGAMSTMFAVAASCADPVSKCRFMSRQKRNTETVTLANEAIVDNPKNAELYYLRGVAYDRLGRLNLALQDLTEACALDPADKDYLSMRGYELRRNERWREAAAVYSQLNDPMSMAMEADCRRRLHEFVRAEKLIDAALKKDPTNKQIRTMAHEFYADTMKEQKALANLSEWQKFDPRNPQIYRMREQLYLDLGRNQEALADADKLIELDGKQSFGEHYILRAQIKSNLADSCGAVSDFSKAISIEPKQSIYYTKRGDCYRSIGDYKAAADDYSSALSLAEANRGETRLKTDLHEAAVLKKHAANILRKRAIAFEKSGQLDKAIADYSTLLDENADIGFALESRVRLLMQAGHYQRAVDDYSKLIEMDDDFVRWRVGRAKAYALLHQNDLAKRDEAEVKRLQQKE